MKTLSNRYLGNKEMVLLQLNSNEVLTLKKNER